MAGLFVTFEGPEGAGKSTQVRLLEEALAAHRPLAVREPGGTPLGEAVRELVLHRHEMQIGAQAESYLFMAARAELLAERIVPALEAGRPVLADRYHDATRVYQGLVGGAAVSWPLSFPRPDLTVLLLVPPELGIRRQVEAGRALDRLEARPIEFHRQVVRGYCRLAEEEPDRFLELDGTRPRQDLHDEVLGLVLARMVEAEAREPAAGQTGEGGPTRTTPP
jgi:dTMP kinase